VNKDILKDYMYLLNRLYEKLPRKVKPTAEFELPQLQITYIGLHTTIKNFAQLCDRIRRTPRIVMRYLLRELAMPGTIDEHGSLTIYGRVSAQTLQTLFSRFMRNYVKCPTCGSYDTILQRQGKIWILRCLACGAETPVRPI